MGGSRNTVVPEETYVYKVGDTGTLKNGLDTYRILATDMVVRPINGIDLSIHTLVITHSDSDEGYTNIYEQCMDFAKSGWSVGRCMAGELGNDEYDLTPPT
ncbi:MAG: hypothetical protein DRI46_10885 [Chloroflexi bacterium]|nr:MAG: hypothetical protein DRI46_10885 [Chloroflexota bacterium]